LTTFGTRQVLLFLILGLITASLANVESMSYNLKPVERAYPNTTKISIDNGKIACNRIQPEEPYVKSFISGKSIILINSRFIFDACAQMDELSESKFDKIVISDSLSSLIDVHTVCKAIYKDKEWRFLSSKEIVETGINNATFL
jgi:hypothetical protein